MILRTDETDLGSSQEAFPGDVKFIGANHNPPSHIPSNSNTRCLLSVFLNSGVCGKSPRHIRTPGPVKLPGVGL